MISRKTETRHGWLRIWAKAAYPRRTTEGYLALDIAVLRRVVFFSLDVQPRSPGREER